MTCRRILASPSRITRLLGVHQQGIGPATIQKIAAPTIQRGGAVMLSALVAAWALVRLWRRPSSAARKMLIVLLSMAVERIGGRSMLLARRRITQTTTTSGIAMVNPRTPTRKWTPTLPCTTTEE